MEAQDRHGVHSNRYLQHGAGSKGVTPLLSQLTSQLLDHQPIPDLQHNNASLG